MLTVLTIAVVFMAFVLTVVYWKVVREALLWVAAIVTILALIASVVTFVLAIIYFDLTLALVGLAFLAVFGVLSAVEEWDRNIQFAKYRAFWNNRAKRTPKG